MDPEDTDPDMDIRELFDAMDHDSLAPALQDESDAMRLALGFVPMEEIKPLLTRLYSAGWRVYTCTRCGDAGVKVRRARARARPKCDAHGPNAYRLCANLAVSIEVAEDRCKAYAAELAVMELRTQLEREFDRQVAELPPRGWFSRTWARMRGRA